MPRIKRWFPVSHDINHSPTIRMLVHDFGAPGLRIWLEILSISDRAGPYIDCTSEGAIRRLSSAAETRFKVVSSVIDTLLRVDSIRIHDRINHITEIVNYWDYHRNEEREKFPPDQTRPNRPDLTIKDKIKTRPSKPTPPAEAMECAQFLSDRIYDNFPSRTPPTEAQLMQWASEADRLNRIDGHSWIQIKDLIAWSQQDGFWRANILSMSKLRQQWNQLIAKQRSNNGAGQNNQTNDRIQKILRRGL